MFKSFGYSLVIFVLVSCKKESQDTPPAQPDFSIQDTTPIKKQFDPQKVGDTLDVFNDVYVFYNGQMETVVGRNLAEDGYNMGLKWQCVEFVKRYYYLHLNHKMPDSYGHAKDFFDFGLRDMEKNKARDLIQFTNGSQSRPEVNDLIVFDGYTHNPYGHLAIVSKVDSDSIEVVQQNVDKTSRERFELVNKDEVWRVNDNGKGVVLGWLRKQ